MAGLDRLYQLAYRAAFQGARVYWKIFRPINHGALVAMWHEGKILLVKNSYLDYFSLPGGHVKEGEQPLDAAVRELKEEIDLVVAPERLAPALEETHEWQGRPDHVVIFHLELSEAPKIRVDNREVVKAEWCTPEQALDRNLFPLLRRVIQERASATA
jgi:8-oxo-dGTP diphosphatase